MMRPRYHGNSYKGKHFAEVVAYSFQRFSPFTSCLEGMVGAQADVVLEK